MQVKFLVSMAGPFVTRNVGDVADVSKAEAKQLLDAGYAVPVAKPPQERAVPRGKAAESRAK